MDGTCAKSEDVYRVRGRKSMDKVMETEEAYDRDADHAQRCAASTVGGVGGIVQTAGKMPVPVPLTEAKPGQAL